MFWFIVICVLIGAIVIIPEVRAIIAAIAGLAIIGFLVIAAGVFILYLLLARH